MLRNIKIIISVLFFFCTLPLFGQQIDKFTNKNAEKGGNKLTFSHDAGFYTNEFVLEINSSSADTIYYTLNGDIPTINSTVYTESITVSDKSSAPNTVCEIPTTPEQKYISYKAWESPSEKIDKATILRCATYRNGKRTSDIYTKTFFVDADMFRKYTVPVLSLVTGRDNFFSADRGIYVPGNQYDADDPEWTGNYFMKGKDWERDVHVEYFEPNGDLAFSQDAGVRIHGGKTRQASQKSLRLYARKEYGEKYFKYKIFPQKSITKYKRLILRTTMGAWSGQTIIADAFAQNVASNLDIDYQDFQPAIVYLNGEYWGIHTIRDRIDERYIEYTHDIDKDDVEFMEPGNSDYQELLDFIENNDLENNNNFDSVCSLIDIDNYIDYTIAELFFSNYDWPANNLKLWHELPNGKWRWVFYDLDAGFGSGKYNMLLHATANDDAIEWPNSPQSTFLFRNLLKNMKFKEMFVDRYAQILNHNFKYIVMKNKLDSITKLYRPEIIKHSERWNYPDNLTKWEDDIDNEILGFIKNRPCVVMGNIMSFFQLSDFDFICNEPVDTLNAINLTPNPNYGHFFVLNNETDISNARVSIFDLAGRIVYEEYNVNIPKGTNKYFNVNALYSGVYILKIHSDKLNFSKKIVVMK